VSDHEQHAGSHAEQPHGEEGHNHPGAKEYLGIAVILTVITAIEVAVFYVPSLKPVLVPTRQEDAFKMKPDQLRGAITPRSND